MNYNDINKIYEKKIDVDNIDILETKEDIYDYLIMMIAPNLYDEEISKNLSDRYKETLFKMSVDFWNKIKQLPLPPVSNEWAFEVYINDTGISLYYCHYVIDSQNKRSYMHNFRVLIYKEQSEMLNLEEFAALYNVQVNTVRQWIRRMKIRTAFMEGGDWKIPKLTDVPKGVRNNTGSTYEFDPSSIEFPEKFAFLSECSGIVFMQKDNKEFITVVCQIKQLNFDEFETHSIHRSLILKEAYELERFCIENSRIYYREYPVNAEINMGQAYRKALIEINRYKEKKEK